MTGDVASHPQQALELPATSAKPPVLSPSLRATVDRAADPHPDVGIRGLALPRGSRGEAEQALARLGQLLTPAEPHRVTAWLTGVNKGVAAPLPGEELARRLPEFVAALRPLPADVFTAATRREAQIAFKFFPSIAEAHALLRAHAAPLIARRDGLRRLLDIGEEASPRPLTQAERDAIGADMQQKLAARIAEMSAEEIKREEVSLHSQTRPLSRDQLRAAYEQQATDENPLVASIARTRLRGLGVDMPEPSRKVEPEASAEDERVPWIDEQ